MEKRFQLYGDSEKVDVFSGPSARRPFRFGNGGVQFSSSYVTIPQKLGNEKVMLGLYTLDAERVPVLIGIRSLEKLGAIIDVLGHWLVLANIAPHVKIPLAKSKAGHLLVNLTTDWLDVSHPFELEASEQYMAASADRVVVEKATGDMQVSHSQLSVAADSPGFCAESCVVPAVHHAYVWMINEGDEVETGSEGEEFVQEAAFLMDHTHHRHDLSAASQSMRDSILSQLAQSHSCFAANHGDREGVRVCKGQEQGDQQSSSEAESSPTTRRALRLEQDPRSESRGRSNSRSSLLRRAHRSRSHSWERVWRQQVGQVDSLRGVWASPLLHSNVGITGNFTSSRSSGSRREEADRGEETREGQHGPQRQEDHPRCSGTLLAEPAQDRSGQEERLVGSAAQEGQQGWSPHEQGRGGGMEESRRALSESEDSGVRRERNMLSRRHSMGRFLPANDSRGAEGVRRDEHSSGSQSSKSRDASRGVGIPRSSSRGRGVLAEGGQVMASKNVDYNLVGSQDACANSFSSSSTTTPAAAQTGNSFTDKDGILPTDAQDILSAEPKSHGKRKQRDADDNEVIINQMDKAETLFLMTEVDKITEEVDQIFLALKASSSSGRPPTVLELCCEEDSGLTKALEQRGGRGIRCGLFNGCDLNKKSGFHKVMTLIRDEQPDLVWVALPCGPTSSIQELNMVTPEGL